MAQQKNIPIRRTLQALFPATYLRQVARENGAVIRERKVDIVELFWVLVLGFAAAPKRSLATLRRDYEKQTGTSIEESSFFKRFNDGLASMLEAALHRGLEKVSMGANRALRENLAAFRDVLITDGSVFRLHDMLARSFRGCRTNHSPAALKAHLVYSVTGKGRQSLKITNGRKHDGPIFKIGGWVKGNLLLFDLAYFRLDTFVRIQRFGGYFVSRLKGTTNPTVVLIHSKMTKAQRRHAHWKTLNDLLPWMKKQGLTTLDAEAIFGNGDRFRIVILKNPHADSFQTYVTNVIPDVLMAEQVRAAYALRWIIELVFKELKSVYRMEDLPSRKKSVVKVLFYAALLTLLTSRCLLAEMRKRMGPDSDRITELRWAALFRMICGEILLLLFTRGGLPALEKKTSRFLWMEALNPDHRSRPPLLQSVESGNHAYRNRNCYA